MEKICRTRISQRGEKTHKPDFPKDPAKRKESQKNKKNEIKTAQVKANPEQNQSKTRAKRRV